MKKIFTRTAKFFAFFAIFYALCAITAFIFCNDSDTYTRALMNEFHRQEKVDVIFCGASHVSHGISPRILDDSIGKSTFCLGTPSQGIVSTYAVIREAVSLFDIKEIFLEADFAVACTTGKTSQNRPSKSMFLAAHYLKNPRVKFDFVLNSTSPKYFLNSLLPVGTEKLIDLNPVHAAKTLREKISLRYYKNVGGGVQQKGCVMDESFIENGTFFSTEIEKEIPVLKISDDYKSTLDKIIGLCRKKNIALFFYINPQSDFYLCEKGNYDEFHSAMKEILRQKGFAFYDFSLCRKEFLDLQDTDYSDDNHLNKSGIEKFTNAFAEFYKSENRSDFFYESYGEKLAAQKEKILGVVFDESPDKKSVRLLPVTNRKKIQDINFSVKFKTRNATTESFFPAEQFFAYPQNQSGSVEIRGFLNGEMQVHAEKFFNSSL